MSKLTIGCFASLVGSMSLDFSVKLAEAAAEKGHQVDFWVSGNGTMVALAVASKEKVDEVYARAIELGGQDEGPAGPRMDGFYAGYFRDLDGNKLNVFYYEAMVG